MFVVKKTRILVPNMASNTEAHTWTVQEISVELGQFNMKIQHHAGRLP